MYSSRWQKRNNDVWRAGSLGVVSITLVAAMVLGTFGLDVIGAIISLIIFVGGMVGLYFARKQNPTSMIRILKFHFEDLERNIRFLFKEQSIVFYRREVEDGYEFELPGRYLKLNISPYETIPNMEFDYQGDVRPVTWVELSGLSEKNEEYANRLASDIDAMAKRMVNERSEQHLVRR